MNAARGISAFAYKGLCGAMRSAPEGTRLMHCAACSRPACVIMGRHIGSGIGRWLPWEPSNIPRQIQEMEIKRTFTAFTYTKVGWLPFSCVTSV